MRGMRDSRVWFWCVALVVAGAAAGCAGPMAVRRGEAAPRLTTPAFSVAVPAGWARSRVTGRPFDLWRFTGPGGRELDILSGTGEETIEHSVRHGLGNLRASLAHPRVGPVRVTAAPGGRKRARVTLTGADLRTRRPVAIAVVSIQGADRRFFSAVLRAPGRTPPAHRLDALLRDLRLSR
jgi:hypothetical protein